MRPLEYVGVFFPVGGYADGPDGSHYEVHIPELKEFCPVIGDTYQNANEKAQISLSEYIATAI